MSSSVTNKVMAFGIIALGVVIGAVGVYIGDTDDAPGASALGLLLMIGAIVLAMKILRRKQS